MNRIVEKTALSPNVTRLVVEAPRLAQVRQPGQFVIVRLGLGSERIPLTIADANAEAGTISLVIQAVGKSTMDLTELQVGTAFVTSPGLSAGRPSCWRAATPFALAAVSGPRSSTPLPRVSTPRACT